MNDQPHSNGFEIPIHRSLTERQLFLGLPRTFALVFWTTSSAFIAGLRQLWIAPIALGIHFAMAMATRKDPFFVEVAWRALKNPRRLDP